MTPKYTLCEDLDILPATIDVMTCLDHISPHAAERHATASRESICSLYMHRIKY